MAVEKSRGFDQAAGAVHVVVQDLHGCLSHHTIYVSGPNGVDDVNAEVTKRMAEVDDAAAKIRARLIAAGMPE
jgi:hypothetical protein